MSNKLNRRVNLLLGITISSILGSIALADTPRDVSGIVGARASSGEEQLRDKGYHFIQSQKGSDRVWSNWWNSASHTCLSVVTKNGRYDSIVSTTSIDCNQNYGSSDSGDKDDHDKNVAVAVGAAALIGAIALAHKSHHHDDDNHYDNVDHEADFERGHRDALYGHSFDNYNNSSEYAQGYSSGVEQRNHDTSYRGNSHSYSNYHQNNNYQRHSSYSQDGVETNDLVGARGSSADDQMRSRGFDHVGNLTSGNTKYTIWYNSDTHQCMQMAMANGRVDSLVDIHSHPNCHR